MRLAILADIHGNWTALTAALEEIDRLGGCDLILGLGDYLYTTTGDRKVVEWLKATQGHFVRGNGDSMAYYAKHRHLAHEDPRDIYECVAGLPERVVLELGGYRIALQHHWWPDIAQPDIPRQMKEAPYVSPAVDLTGIDIAIFGDSHLPLHHATPDTLIVHPGSVGAPFDADPSSAKFATLEMAPDGVLLTHHAAPFDIHAANREIIEGRAIDIGHSYYRKMTEFRVRIASPNGEHWEPVPPAVRWRPQIAHKDHPLQQPEA